jgi:hypothetical protein
MARRYSFSWLVVALCALVAACDKTQPTPLSVSSISPRAGSMSGGTRVTISGVGFKPGAIVQFAGIPAVTLTVTPNTITADTPAYAAGGVIVIVTNTDSHSATLPGVFTYEVEPAFTISGTITELTPDGEAPVDGVKIQESGTRSFVLTDATGTYRLGNLRLPSFTIVISKAGYDSITTPVTATSDVQINRRITRFLAFVLSGLVYETTPSGRVPLNGVVLYCDGCGSPDGHTFVTTDANGLYAFEWTRNGKNWIQFVSKDGYRYAGPIELFGIPVTVDGNTTFDIELVKR